METSRPFKVSSYRPEADRSDGEDWENKICFIRNISKEYLYGSAEYLSFSQMRPKCFVQSKLQWKNQSCVTFHS